MRKAPVQYIQTQHGKGQNNTELTYFPISNYGLAGLRALCYTQGCCVYSVFLWDTENIELDADITESHLSF